MTEGELLDVPAATRQLEPVPGLEPMPGSTSSSVLPRVHAGAVQLKNTERDAETWLGGVADGRGTGRPFRQLVQLARDLGLHVRFQNQWWVAMITTPENKNRYLVDLGADLHYWVNAEALAARTGRSESDVLQALGGEEGSLTADGVERWAASFSELFRTPRP